VAAGSIRATFFCVGERVARHRSCAADCGRGHALENHSHRHQFWTNLLAEGNSKPTSRREGGNSPDIGANAGVVRPPMGLTNPRVFRVARKIEAGIAATRARPGSRADGPERDCSRRGGLRPGAILLLHDGGVPGGAVDGHGDGAHGHA